VPTVLARARQWPGIAGLILVTVVLVPPVAGYARQFAFVQALQFVIFAVACPALLALGTPWRTRAPARGPGVAGIPRRPGTRAAIRLAVFGALAIAWRLPGTLDALARTPALAAAEMITLLAAGTGIWREVTSQRPGPRQLPRPARAALATAAMWTIWVLAYLTGMSGVSWLAAYHRGGAGGLSAAADQQVTAAILWAVPALCFLPAVYVTVMAWLAGPAGSGHPAGSGGTPPGGPRPPRGWRASRTRLPGGFRQAGHWPPARFT
jgi:cytochrome c oxidase assembly factor CtaG